MAPRESGNRFCEGGIASREGRNKFRASATRFRDHGEASREHRDVGRDETKENDRSEREPTACGTGESSPSDLRPKPEIFKREKWKLVNRYSLGRAPTKIPSLKIENQFSSDHTWSVT